MQVRPAGRPIKGFGGVTSGPQPLIDLQYSPLALTLSATPHRRYRHARMQSTDGRRLCSSAVRGTLSEQVGQTISISTIVDIMNLIGRCVVSGNVRRTAEIAFGSAGSQEYIDLKNYEVNPERAAFGWVSNNSVFAEVGMDYEQICKRIEINGEPGVAWLANMQNFSRMDGKADGKDSKALGGNPCLEQTLESFELCCLVETFPHKHTDLADYLETLKYAFLYAKTVTLASTHWEASNAVMARNRRIGCSMSGLAQFVSSRGIDELRQWCEEGYHAIQSLDQRLSRWLCIPQSIKTTCIKPSGTVSLLAGATPGLHYPESRYYIRRVRLAKSSPLLPPLLSAGYDVEDAVGDTATAVVSFPIDAGEGIRTISQLTLWEQLSFAAFLQRHWADNQVSCTVTFDPETESRDIRHALNYFQYQLKGVSFLPRLKLGAYAQMPYEEISAECYGTMVSRLQPLVFTQARAADPEKELFCDSSGCAAV